MGKAQDHTRKIASIIFVPPETLLQLSPASLEMLVHETHQAIQDVPIPTLSPQGTWAGDPCAVPQRPSGGFRTSPLDVYIKAEARKSAYRLMVADLWRMESKTATALTERYSRNGLRHNENGVDFYSEMSGNRK
ncbi:hypothetical protein J6590_073511 [Homalodisca vitripennis]|nr:hypothetical protein J6590_073511 [Homalodisca vitripennis]